LPLRLGAGDGLGFEPFLAQQAPPQRPSQFGQQHRPTLVSVAAALQQSWPTTADMGRAQNPTVPKLSASRQTKTVRQMDFFRCMAVALYGTCAGKVQ